MLGRASRVACILAAALLLSVIVIPTRAGVISIAPSSYAAFSVRLLWLKHIRGRFEKLYGQLDWSPDQHQGVVRAWIDATSARMRSTRYRRMLLGPGFLDVEKYPRIHFVSDPIGRHLLHHGGGLRGLLSMHGATRPFTFTLQPSNCLAPETTVCILRLHGSVQRSRFGIRQHSTILSDRVQLDLVIVLTPRGAGTARR